MIQVTTCNATMQRNNKTKKKKTEICYHKYARGVFGLLKETSTDGNQLASSHIVAKPQKGYNSFKDKHQRTHASIFPRERLNVYRLSKEGWSAWTFPQFIFCWASFKKQTKLNTQKHELYLKMPYRKKHKVLFGICVHKSGT